MGTKGDGRKNRGGRKKGADVQGVKEEKDEKPSTNIKKNVGGEPGVRTYFKVFASFKCSNEKCKKSWQSAHAWEREDDEDAGGINCEVCQKPAELINAKDEMLKLDTYICMCENMWQSIHVEENSTVPQECDICKVMVLPDGAPQERFGRHYWLQCANKNCPEKENSEWEDFSLTKQKTQRCTKCYSRGDIVKVSKLRQMPPWLWKRRQELRGRRRADDDDKEERPSNHVTEFCDMCQDIRRQNKGKNCRQWRMIKTKLEDKEDGSEPEEVIIELNHFSLNPFHFDSKPITVQ